MYQGWAKTGSQYQGTVKPKIIHSDLKGSDKKRQKLIIQCWSLYFNIKLYLNTYK